MRNYQDKIPLVRIVEWIRGNRVALFFSDGRAVEVELPWVQSAKGAHVVDDGMAIDPGNGRDVDAITLSTLPARVLVRGSQRRPPTRKRRVVL